MKLSNILKKYAKKQKTPLKLNFLYNYGKSISSRNLLEQSKFLHEELPIRLSHRVFDLLKLPYGLPLIPEIKGVVELYCDSFNRILETKKPTNDSDILDFTNLVEDIKDNHTNLEESIAKGLRSIDNPLIDYSLINNGLDKFFLSRIGIRTLISQQIQTVKLKKSTIVDCNLNTILKDSINTVNDIGDRVYGDIPDIKLDTKDINMRYIPEHLYYATLEILKNSVVSQVENDVLDKNIEITTSEGKDDVIIKIADFGKGFPFKKIPKVLSYSYSTTPIDITEEYELCNIPIMSGFGFGLPMARSYCRYFGGDLRINPIENIGTEVFIYIHKLGNEEERLY